MQRKYIDKFINLIMFIYIISIYIFTYRQNLNDISNILALILIGLIWIRFLINKQKFQFNKVLFLYLIFILICGSTIFYAINPSIALGRLKTLILLLLLMISLSNYVDTVKKVENIITYFIYAGIITSIYMLGKGDFSNIERLGAQLGNVNTIGIDLGISIASCLHKVINKKKYIYSLALLLMTVCVFLTGSRSALLFTLINIAFILYLKNKQSLIGKAKVLIICAGVLLISYYLIFNIPFFYEVIGKRIESLFSFLGGDSAKEGSVYLRSYMTKFGFEMFKNRPFFGYGLDNYRILLLKNIGEMTYAHNNYIELLVDVGICGTVAYYSTHIMTIKKLNKQLKESKLDMLGYVFISIIISYIILAPTMIYYYSKQFSIILAVASSLSSINKKIT